MKNLKIRLSSNFHKSKLHMLTHLLAQVSGLSMRLRLRIEWLKICQKMKDKKFSKITKLTSETISEQLIVYVCLSEA